MGAEGPLEERVRRAVCKVILCHGRLIHKWQLQGSDLIPKAGPCLLVYHHGTMPVDYLYLVADTYLRTGRLIHSIVDRSLLLVPGLGSIAYLMRCSAPSREKATALLSAGNIVGVAPGGGRQAMH